jgi:4-amino-4-deoxychorismate lyase
MAGIAKNTSGTDDMILLDTNGHISECIASNIFWMKKGHLYTPSLQSACIAGVMRKQILQLAAKMAITVQEGLFPISDILEADAVFCSNITCIQAIYQIEDTVFDTKKLPEELLAIG